MSSVLKTGFSRKTGSAIVGVALLGSIMLTACTPSTSENNASQPSASASVPASEAPKGIEKFKSEAFDLTKQVSLKVTKADDNILLPAGVVTREKDGDTTKSVSFTPYESTEGAWTYQTDFKVGGVNHMRWNDKSYIVVNGLLTTDEPASGLIAAKKNTVENVVVLDATTGKVANALTGAPQEGGGNLNALTNTIFKDNDPNKGSTDPRNVSEAFMNGLVYQIRTGGSFELVDPLTGATVAYDETDRKGALNNETGFYARGTTDASGNDLTRVKATFGNYALIATPQPEYKSAKGYYVQHSKYSLMDTTTKKVVSEMDCVDGGDRLKTSYSPDFRYVNFLGEFVFDTKTGKSFCAAPAKKEDVRKVTVLNVDNDGNMYATADREYMRISLADNTKIETLLEGDFFGADLPIFITENGSAVFYSDKGDKPMVVVPAKEKKD